MKENETIRLCRTCSYMFNKVSKFRQSCIQSQIFLNKHCYENQVYKYIKKLFIKPRTSDNDIFLIQISVTLLCEEKSSANVFNHLELLENFSLSISDGANNDSKNVINLTHLEDQPLDLMNITVKTENQDSDSDGPLSAYKKDTKLENKKKDTEKKKKIKKLKVNLVLYP